MRQASAGAVPGQRAERAKVARPDKGLSSPAALFAAIASFAAPEIQGLLQPAA